MNTQSGITTVFTKDLETKESMERMSFRQLRKQLLIFRFHNVKSMPVLAVRLSKAKTVREGDRKNVLSDWKVL